jgi:2',3'-cyclic-nucleotide 2'-phosphodiesterase (5'-nucleotidase family)
MFRKTAWLAMPLVAALAGCNSDNDNSTEIDSSAFTMNILHINDHHSNVEEGSQALTIAGQETEFTAGGFPRVSAKLQNAQPNWITCSNCMPETPSPALCISHPLKVRQTPS